MAFIKKTLETLTRYKILIVRIIFFILIPLIIYLVLYFNEKVDIIYNHLNNRLSSLGVVSVCTFVSIFFLDILKGWFSNYVTDKIFPGDIIEVKRNTEDLIKEQKAQNLKINNILQSISFDPKNIRKQLKDLVKLKTSTEQLNEIENLFRGKVISEKEKEILIISIEEYQTSFESLKNEIHALKENTTKTFKQAYEHIIDCYFNANPEGLRHNYLDIAKKATKEQRVKILQLSIQVSEWLYALEVSDWMYEELITINPTALNYFKHGTLFEEFNQFEIAEVKYKKALSLISNGSKEEEILSLKAHILNNIANVNAQLAVIKSDESRVHNAIQTYQKCINVYVELEKEYPKKYLFDIAESSKNISSVLAVVGFKEDAQKRNDIAKNTIQYLIKKDVNNIKYKIEYAKIIINEVMYLGKKIKNLKKAEKILKKYSQNQKNKELLQLIYELRNN